MDGVMGFDDLVSLADLWPVHRWQQLDSFSWAG
jgi:hypothetical protein